MAPLSNSIKASSGTLPSCESWASQSVTGILRAVSLMLLWSPAEISINQDWCLPAFSSTYTSDSLICTCFYLTSFLLQTFILFLLPSPTLTLNAWMCGDRGLNWWIICSAGTLELRNDSFKSQNNVVFVIRRKRNILYTLYCMRLRRNAYINTAIINHGLSYCRIDAWLWNPMNTPTVSYLWKSSPQNENCVIIYLLSSDSICWIFSINWKRV